MRTNASKLLFLALLSAALPAQETKGSGTAPLTSDLLAMGKMWTFENPPLAYLEKEYGFKPDQRWLDSLRMSALRLGERDRPWCSAAFVSPQGLIMTNHHCVRDEIAKHQGENNWGDDGYAAKELADEYPMPGLTVQQLLQQEDVTAKVNAAVVEGDDDATIAKKRAEAIEAIKKAADEAHPDRMHQVVSLWQGAVYQLYSYNVYDDVRLVLAPHLQTAHFGGDPDNFTFPRYSIDFSFLRAYGKDGKPADTSANYFRFRNEGAKDGELVFVAGNPGNTNRMMTIAQLEYMRDLENPMTVQLLTNGLRILKAFADSDERMAKSLSTTILGWENSQKAIGGMLEGMRDQALMDLKRGSEQRFRAAVEADPQLKSRYGNVWDRIAELAKEKRELQPRVMFHTPSYSNVIGRAVKVLQAVDSTQSAEEREAAKAEALGMPMRGNAITQNLLFDHFTRAREWLPKDDAYLTAFFGDQLGAAEVNWDAVLQRIGASKLGQKKFVTELLEGGAEAVNASDDIGLQIAKVLWPLMRDNAEREEKVNAALEVQGTLIGQALFAVYGSGTSPDATMTLRFSDGVVKGYEYNGTLAPWATSFYGLYGRNKEFAGVHPFDLPKVWADAVQKVDMAKKVCFVSTNDIVGGNSGSSIVDKDLQVVGLIFDGNIESLPNDFYYTQSKARAVSVHTDAIVESLTKVYEGQRIADELKAGAASAGAKKVEGK